MFPRLIEKSFVKEKPDSFVLNPYKNKIRESLVLNKSAGNILKLCDGTHEINSIVSILEKKYDEKESVVRENVNEFLKQFIECGVIEDKKSEKPFCSLRGSSEVFYPDVLIWELTDYCPLKCRHCYLPKKNNNIMSRKDIDQILRTIDEMGVYQVQLTGGEVLTHPDFGYIVDQLISRGIIVAVSTSGMLLNDKLLNDLLRLKDVAGSFIRVSLDGNKNTHNYIRRNDSSYDNAIKFLKKMSSVGIECQIGTTVVDQTKEELEEMTAMAKEIGVSLVEMGMVCVQGNAKENNMNPSFDSKKLKDFLKYLSDKYSDKKFTVKVPKKLKDIRNCGAGYQVVTIKANKDIAICPIIEFSLGNLNNQSMYDIMNNCGEIFYNFKAPCEQFCDKCEHEHECTGCMARAFNFKDQVEDCKWFKSEGNKIESFVK